MNILVGNAWPYANGSLHIGHLAALLPGDIIARYHRAIGNKVYFVSGSDCHGTPVSVRARKENKTPKEISDYYHHEFLEVFKKFGFSYDYYGKTSSEEHINFVTEFHRKMYENKDFIYEKLSPQAYCDQCESTLVDRFVIGKCPVCGENARGDQCDACGTILEPENLILPRCSTCGNSPEFIESKHLYIAISKLTSELTELLNSHAKWRKNAKTFTKRYIDEGLRDRAITRQLDWGIDVPKDDYKDKKIYIWAENVLGYLSMSNVVAGGDNQSFKELWFGENAIHYYVHGKDNIPFHTIILPALLMASGSRWHLPDVIVSSEYLTLEGRKISTSQNWAIWAKDIVDRYNPDSLRYYLIANGPEKRDSDFSWREFVNSHNGELLGAYGNFVNRSLVFIQKYFDKLIPNGTIHIEIETKIEQLFHNVGDKILKGECKEALDDIFGFIRFANKFFDESIPWKTRETDIVTCENTLFNCVQIVANISILLNPFMPFSSNKIFSWLQVNSDWKPQYVSTGYKLPDIEILFERLDKRMIEDELKKLTICTTTTG